MAEKIFSNVRLGLKIDTLENWDNSSIVLKKGELAFATASAAAGTGLTEPVIMVKIGDGEHTFTNLGWDFYAKASDVLAACKSEKTLKTFINNVIADAGIATDEALAQLANRVTAVEGKAGANETAIGVLNDDAQTAGSVAKSISDAIAALDLANTYEAKGEAAEALDNAKAYTDALANGAVRGNTEAIAAIKDGASIDSFKDVEDALAGKQAAGDYATKAEAQGYANAKVASVTAADNSVTVGGTATAPTVGVKVSAASGNVLELADDGLKVTIPAAAEYTIEKDESSADYAAVYRLKKDGVQVGAEINIPKDMVVESGSVVEDPAGQPAGTYIKLVLQNVAEPLYINVGSLIEYVTSGSQAGDMVVITVDANHQVTATITDGSITLAKLAAGIQTSLNKANTALQEANIETGTSDGTIKVGTKEVAVAGLGSAAYEDKDAFDASGAAAAVLGDSSDEADANTVYGAKAAIATLNGKGEGSVKKTVADAIAALDVADAAVADQFVTAVSETDGKISVSRATLTLATLNRGDLETEIVFDCGGSGATTA